MRAERRQASRAVAGAYGRILRRAGGPALLTLMAGLAGAWAGEAHAQAAPTLPKAIPDYGDNSITISWVDNANDETGFEIERTEGANVVTYNAAANAVSYKDATPATDKEYSYRVRAIKNAAASAWTAAVAQNVKTVWPVPGSHEILHNWNETIGSAGVDEQSNARGFHMGVDIQRLASPEPVVAVRGGVVAHAPAAAAGAKENYVIIKIQVGANVEYASYNHLDPALLVVVNDVVKAGQAIGKISELTFIPPGWVQHTHFFFANPWHALDKDPLSVFAAAADKDPQGKKPALTEHNTAAPDGTMLYRSQGAAGGVYFAKDLPISGHVDIIAELSDELGTNPDQVPTKVGYWIEPPTDVADCPAFHGVKTAAAPYVLYEWSTRYMGDYGGLARSQAIVDYSQNLGPLFIEGGKAYRWENYKHFVVTNTKGADAAPDSIDEAQYWNTKARQDGGAVTIATANYAGKPDATRPTEARFPDGVYKIHLIASDLVNANEALAVQEVRVENFCPIVCQCEPRGLINCPASVAGFVTFNEAMDVSIAPADIVKIDSGATLTGLTWVGETKITFTIRDLQPGQTYNLRVKGAGATPARDKPPKAGTPGNALDGDKDGVCGDDYIGVFSCGANNNNNNNNNNNANANNNNGNDNLANNNNGNGNNNNGNGNDNNGNGNNNNGNNNNNSNNNNGNNNNGNGPPATLIELFGFGATTVGDGRIELAWQTGSERGTVGYNVLRSAGDDLPRVRLNARLIPARGAETVGARYAFADSGVAPNVAYRYWLQELESDGRTHVYGPVAGRWELRFALQAPYPNPFRQAVLIPFSVPVPARVTMRIFDVRGRLLREFNQDKLAIGSHVIRWDGLDTEGHSVANGIYFARMTAADFGATRKLVLIR